MAEYENKPGDFVLFPNNRMRPDKRDPDYTGTFYGKVGENGKPKEHYVSVWARFEADGSIKLLSGNVGKEKAPQGAANRAGPPPPSRPAPPQRGPAPQQRPIQQKQVVQTDFGTVEGEVVEESPF